MGAEEPSTERDRQPVIASALALTAARTSVRSVPAATAILTEHLTLVKTAAIDLLVAHLVTTNEGPDRGSVSV